MDIEEMKATFRKLEALKVKCQRKAKVFDEKPEEQEIVIDYPTLRNAVAGIAYLISRLENQASLGQGREMRTEKEIRDAIDMLTEYAMRAKNDGRQDTGKLISCFAGGLEWAVGDDIVNGVENPICVLMRE